mmetsp:Transcript_28828/g.77585  ORF Transcript_28828/g.77585 Transcript_28828/m.77585 type:complete len:222 (+) Transcript_28828:540-1205(+)
MRSATPQLSRKVWSLMPEKNILQNWMVSARPMRMMAALVLPPRPSPSQKPAPRATTFLRAPQSSTPDTSWMEDTLKVGQSKSSCHTAPFAGVAKPTVDSQNSSRAASLATLAPMSTDTSMPPISSLMRLEMRMGPSSLNSMPLMREQARAPLAWLPLILGQMRVRNWWGSTKMSSVASCTALSRSGSATTLSVNFTPLRYLTFSCSVLMMSVRFLPSTCSW